ncbi:MAG: YggS family pyridoxal phosphate-dependent enzyme [Spirochaetales bacterium]
MIPLSYVQERIRNACQRAGRKEDEVRLMAVTKLQNWDSVLETYQAGIRIFGENRVQEAKSKYSNPLKDMELHLIGPLQSNKAKYIPSLFQWVDSIDRFAIAEELEKRLAKLEFTLQVLLELNTSGEATKSGYTSYDLLLRDVDRILRLPHLNIRGLMTLGPLTTDQNQIRKAFRTLYQTYEDLKQRYPEVLWDTLSMGMSGDFEIAIEEGSTLIRLGTLLFGERS